MLAFSPLNYEAPHGGVITPAVSFLLFSPPFSSFFCAFLLSKHEVPFIPHGANGVLHEKELDIFGALKPAGQTGKDRMEFVLPMAAQYP
jgi:hypothetical protein